MKISGALSLVLALIAFILSFLLIFAGNHPGVMTSPTYSIISVNTSQIGENIVRQVVDQYLNDPEKLLQLLNGLFANVIGSTLRGNTTGIQSILGGSGVTLPSGILPSGVTIPTALPSTISIPSISISIPTSLPIPTNLQIPGLGGKVRRNAEAEAEADLEYSQFDSPIAAPVQAELVAHSPFDEDLILRAVGGDLRKRDIITDILGSIPGGSSTFKNFSLADLPIAKQLANRIVQQFAAQIGIYDFYDFHILKYCLGNYYPAAKANATVPQSSIKRNVTQCPSYDDLDLKTSVSNLLNNTGFASQGNVSLSSINFPDDLDSYINLAKSLLKALTALYAVVIGMSFFIMVLSIVALFKSGREVGLGTCIWLFALLGMICSAVASIIVTAAGRIIANKIGDLGNQLGLSYQIGSGYLGMTWTTFGCMLIISILTCFLCCSGRRRNRRERKADKARQIEKAEKGEKNGYT